MTSTTIDIPAKSQQAGIASDDVAPYGQPMDTRKRTMRIDEALKRARDTGKPVNIPKGDGVYLCCRPSGVASWRWKYRWANEVRTAVFGRIGELNEAQAKERRWDFKRKIDAGIDPERQESTPAAARVLFRTYADEWFTKRSNANGNKPWDKATAAAVRRVLDAYLLPSLGDRPIADIDAGELLRVIEAIPSRTQAVHAFQHCRAIFARAQVDKARSGVRENPAYAIRDAGDAPSRRSDQREVHQPAVIDVAQARRVLQAVEGSGVHEMQKLAHRFLALTGVRKMEAFNAQWDEVRRGDAWRWELPAGRMKAGKVHEVPLSTQAREVLEAAEAWQRVNGVASPYVFARTNRAAAPWNRSTINETLGRVLPKAGFDVGTSSRTLKDGTVEQYRRQAHSVHGWRSTFSTLLADAGQDDMHIERCLAHEVLDRTAQAYKQAKYRDPKRAIFQLWADLLIGGEVASPSSLAGLPAPNVVPLKRAA